MSFHTPSIFIPLLEPEKNLSKDRSFFGQFLWLNSIRKVGVWRLHRTIFRLSKIMTTVGIQLYITGKLIARVILFGSTLDFRE